MPDTDHYHHDSYHSNHDHVVANGYQEVVVVVVVVVLVKREIGRKGRLACCYGSLQVTMTTTMATRLDTEQRNIRSDGCDDCGCYDDESRGGCYGYDGCYARVHLIHF